MPLKMIKISYLIALYNKENFILSAIDSVLQDASEEFEIEICIVDDGSTDDSLNIVCEKYKDDGRIFIDSFSKNQGKVAAYNRAFEMCSGNYLALLGADDMVLLGRTSAMLEMSHLSGKSVYGGLIKYIEQTGSKTVSLPYELIDFRLNIIENKFSGGALLMRRSDCANIFPIPDHLKFEDWWISFHLLRKGVVSVLNQPVTFYRIHGANDCGVERISYASMRRDYSRHLDCLEAFRPYIENPIDKLYLQRSISLRRCFFGARDFFGLLHIPFDKSWLKLLLFNVAGARLTLLFHSIKGRLIS